MKKIKEIWESFTYAECWDWILPILYILTVIAALVLSVIVIQKSN